MSQQINLYQPIFRTQKKIFSALTVVQIAGLFVIGLMLIYGYARWQVNTLEAQVANVEAQRQLSLVQMEALAAQPPTARSRLVEEQLREARTEAEQKQRLLRAFETRRLGNTEGFAAHFTGLARQRIDGLWLTRIEVRDGAISFEGATEAAELVPRYLTRLGRERAFAGTEFAQLRLTRGDDGDEPVSFAVTTAVERTP